MTGFDALHPSIQKWVYRQGWASLRPIQALAVEPVLKAGVDVILAAATASGKTEAAFLPILTRVLAEAPASIGVLYVGPLKALINDQFQRMELLCQELAVPVHRWHGDVSAGRKHKVLREPRGVLLITPESLEAIFIRQGPRVAALFSDLAYVVVDEVHAYPGSERGRQLQSLLHRLELVVRRRVPRVGLSATLGDMALAQEYLRPGNPDRVLVLTANDRPEELRLQIRGYEQKAPRTGDTATSSPAEGTTPAQLPPASDEEIAAHLFKVLRGGHHLVFANRKSQVEWLADRLRVESDDQRVPNEFWPHHGSLSKEIREEVERRVKSHVPTTVVCTSTLEMGVDIGSIESVAQVGCPPGVGSLRQRLGRSGRREGGSATPTLRIYVSEPEVTPQTQPADALRSSLFQSVAMLQLLLKGWCEPPESGALHLSTLVQQFLSLIAQRSQITPDQAFRVLCDGGPFHAVDEGLYNEVIEALRRGDYVTPVEGQAVTLGLQGERLVGHFSFYTAFNTPEEWSVVTEGQALGRLPLTQPMTVGQLLTIAGRRWRVVGVDDDRREIRVRPSKGGAPPTFPGQGPRIHERVRVEMRSLYTARSVPGYLDATAQRFLTEGREFFARTGLFEQSVWAHGSEVILAPWTGDRILGTLVLMLQGEGLSASIDGPLITIHQATLEGVRDLLVAMASAAPPDAYRLADQVLNLVREKHDRLLPREALLADFVAKEIDVAGAHATLRSLF